MAAVDGGREAREAEWIQGDQGEDWYSCLDKRCWWLWTKVETEKMERKN